MNKKKILKILATVLVLVSLPVGLVVTGAMLPSFYGETYYAELARMYQRLYETQGKKLVVLGGSNVAFGLDGRLLEDTLRDRGFDYTVCPFGLYAAVGTSAMLELSADALGPGDVVVLAIEPGAQALSTYFGATAFWKCAEDAPRMLRHLEGNHASALLGNYVTYLQERVSILMNGNAPVSEGVYAIASFNDRCDMIYDRPYNIMAVGYDTAMTVDLESISVEPAFRQQIHDYCRKAREKGAQVVMSFSPVNRSAVADHSQTAVGNYFQMLNESFDCPIISNPNDYILPSGWFYDNNFHLNNAGARLRTCLLADDLLTFLGCYEALSFEMPRMPEVPQNEPQEEQGSTDFQFEAVKDENGQVTHYLVSGLTAGGLDQGELTVPGSYRGKAVTGFTAQALQNAPKLETLRLPASIAFLPDGLFRNCTAMEKLILEHEKNTCTVTEHTFDGADRLRILIPEAAYALYRDGVGCEENSWYPYLDRIDTY